MTDAVPEKDDSIDRIIDPRPQAANSEEVELRAQDPIAGALDLAPNSRELDAAEDRLEAPQRSRDPIDHVLDHLTGQESSEE